MENLRRAVQPNKVTLQPHGNMDEKQLCFVPRKENLEEY